MNLKRLLRPAPHLERDAAQHALLVGVGAVLALGAVGGIAWAAGFGRVLHELRHFDPIWLPVAFGMEVAAYFGYVVAYREVARLEGGPRLGLARAGAIVAAGFGAFVIRGGFVVDRHALEAAGLEARQARLRVLSLGVLEYAVLAPAAALAAVILLARGSTHPSLGFTLPWVIAVPLGFAAAFAALALRPRLRDQGGWRGALRHALDAVHMLKKLSSQGAVHGGAFFGTTLYWIGDVGCLWAGLRAFHDSPDLAALVIGYATGYALTRRTLPLGGAGSVEALVTFALAWAGIPLAKAVLAVCAYRLFNLWLPLLPAAIGLRHLKRWRDLAAGAG
ncbi:MAG TPA: lysylphosphatidylglycerol synthase domain-containing protein [Gaiellaceae bacterium]|nr:lysylphosphatidylglycerol synthase domain-containing protein [Gaiellaceae bacterium]